MMMLLIDDGRGGVRGVEPTRADRFLARVMARRIDRDLANGASPDSDVVVALHAKRLTGMRERRRLADGLAYALMLSTEPRTTGISSSIVNRRAVAGAEVDVLELCRHLVSPGPVSVRGVATVRALLTTGMGPLYDIVPGGSLSAALRHADELLEAVDTAA